MGSVFGKAPKPPDPAETARAQGTMNKETAQEQARLNRVDQYGPGGSVVYRSTGMEDNPYMRVTTLSPEQQKLYNSQSASEVKLADLSGKLIDRVSPTMAKPLDMSGAPEVNRFDMSGAPAPGSYQSYGPLNMGSFSMKGAPRVDEVTLQRGYGGPSGKYDMSGAPAMPEADAAERKRIEAALMERMAPHLQQDEEALRTRLANTGFDMNSQGYNSAMDVNTRQRNDARLGAIAQGGDEMARQFGMQAQARGLYGQEEAARVGFQNQRRAQNLQAQQQANAASQAMLGSQERARERAAAERAMALGFQRQGETTNADQAFRDQSANLAQQNFARDQYGREQGQQTQYDQAARDSYLNELMTSRAQPINEIAALLGTGQVNVPNAGGVPQVGMQSPDLMGLTNQQYQANLANHQSSQGGLFGIGGSVAGALPWTKMLGF